MKRVLFLLLLFFAFASSGFAQEKHADGKYREDYGNGQAKVKGFYKNNQKVKHWRYFDKDGALEQQIIYRQDSVIWIFKYRKGKMIEKTDRKGKVYKKPECGC